MIDAGHYVLPSEYAPGASPAAEFSCRSTRSPSTTPRQIHPDKRSSVGPPPSNTDGSTALRPDTNKAIRSAGARGAARTGEVCGDNEIERMGEGEV